MKNVISKTAIFLGAILILVSSSMSYAEGAEGGEAKGHFKADHEERMKEKTKRFDDMAQQLGLSPEQQEQMKEQRKQGRENKKALYGQLKEKHKELRQELQKAVSDDNEITRITSEMKDINSQLIDQRVESIRGMKSILTPEQYEKFKEKTAEMKERHKKRGGKKHGPE